jgi:hypothetical protein
MFGVTRRLKGRITGWLKSVRGTFGVWLYDSYKKGVQLSLRQKSALLAKQEPGVNRDWRWLVRTVPAAAKVMQPCAGAWGPGLTSRSREDDPDRYVPVRAGLGGSGFTCASAVVNYHASKHTDVKDTDRAGSVIIFTDLGADGKPASAPTSGNDFALTTLRVGVRCPSAVRLWCDTLVYEHHGLPVRCPAGVLRVSSARTAHKKILDIIGKQ